MILLVAASERGFLAKLHACDTWQGLRVWGCGVQWIQAAIWVRVCACRRKSFGMVYRSG